MVECFSNLDRANKIAMWLAVSELQLSPAAVEGMYSNHYTTMPADGEGALMLPVSIKGSTSLIQTEISHQLYDGQPWNVSCSRP